MPRLTAPRSRALIARTTLPSVHPPPTSPIVPADQAVAALDFPDVHEGREPRMDLPGHFLIVFAKPRLPP